MKPVHSLVACSLLGGAFLAVSCAGDEAKKKVGGAEAGAGGDEQATAGEASGGGSQVAQAGAGGQAVSSGGVGGEGGAGGAAAPVAMSGAGAGGEAPLPLCFEPEGAAGATGSGGQGGASPAPFSFRCDALTGYYDSVNSRVVLDAGTGLEPTIAGDFTYRYDYQGDPYTEYGCQQGQLAGRGSELWLPIDASQAPLSQLSISLLRVKDACSNEVTMDISGSDGTCHVLRFFPADGDTWQIDCYEGFSSDCAADCLFD